MNVGIVGRGFVGGAMYKNFKDVFPTEVYDIDETKRTCSSMDELVNHSDIIFVCVPTPSSADGSCDVSIVEKVVKKIASYKKDVVVIIKSTVVPGTTKRLIQETGLKIAFNPEFLTERNADEDFRYQKLIVVGCEDTETNDKVWEVYYKFVVKVGYMPLMKSCTTDEAEMFKYLANCFLATKVIFANEFKILCDKVGIEYSNIASIAKLDNRLGPTHWQVPGPDGKYGYGGSCFPKDTAAMIAFAEEKKESLWLVTETTYINDDIRENKYFNAFEVADDK
jgi:nucleotide sugar dehydrogenase